METALLKLLKLFRDTAQSLTEKQIADRIKEDQIYVAKALGKLREREVVVKNGEFYSYRKTLVNERLLERMLAVYDKISGRSEIESLIIDLLSAATQYKCLLRQNTLLRVLVEEGFDSDQILLFLDEELKEGRIRKLKVAMKSEVEDFSPVPPAIPWYYTRRLLLLDEELKEGSVRELKVAIKGKAESFFPFPPTVPWYYTSHLLRMNDDEYERLKERWIDEGFFIQEEDYLIANFPPEMVDSAREYLDKEMAQVRQKIREESFEWWYGLRVGWEYLRYMRMK